MIRGSIIVMFLLSFQFVIEAQYDISQHHFEPISYIKGVKEVKKFEIDSLGEKELKRIERYTENGSPVFTEELTPIGYYSIEYFYDNEVSGTIARSSYNKDSIITIKDRAQGIEIIKKYDSLGTLIRYDTVEFTYEGGLKTKEFKTSISGDLKFEKRTSFSYENGNWIKELIETRAPNYNKWTVDWGREFVYDNNDSLVEYWTYDKNHNEVMRSKYEYREDTIVQYKYYEGECDGAEYYCLNDRGYFSKIYTTSDCEGQMIRLEEFFYYNKNGWQVRFDSFIHSELYQTNYEYYENGLIKEIFVSEDDGEGSYHLHYEYEYY